jgi:starch synthase (maltosyl-transferring)
MKTERNSEVGTETIPKSFEGRRRAVIDNVRPRVDCGRYAIKRVLGESVAVEADAFADGHDRVACDLLYRHDGDAQWRRTPMLPLGDDRWHARFVVESLGRYVYSIAAWVDHFETWRGDLERRLEARQDLTLPLRSGEQLIRAAAARAAAVDAARLTQWADAIGAQEDANRAYGLARERELAELMRRYPDPDIVSVHPTELPVIVEREKARFSSWYELFPRSCSSTPMAHGTLRDCAARLPYVAEMGFDIVYLPPLHPIGLTFRKGRNNATQAQPGDVGSPWAIGAAAGGHKSIHPELGSLADLRFLVQRANELGMEVALDIAFQCTPDHPYVTEHPEWFLKRPDGSIQYAENPPKKYQDIYPFDFESAHWQALWRELKSVVDFWIGQGIFIFRVDNPHTKPFGFWEWIIGEVRREHPEVIFLAEAFTRPRVMHRLAKLGFSQSYTYFTWRNTKHELIEYFTELTQSEGREYFRPNLWPNTPDILNEYLQFGGRPAFVTRLVLAATLGSNFGVYGPAFELCENQPREPGSEEYLDSEKYQIRSWDLQRPDSLKDMIATLNRIRRRHPALQRDWGLRFHAVDNERLIAYSKSTDNGEDAVLVVANLDPFNVQAGRLELPLDEFRLSPSQPYQMHDLLSGARYIWQGATNFVSLDPQGVAAHVFHLRRRVRSERDFDYFL